MILYSNVTSYYSSLARLALHGSGIDFSLKSIDIHGKQEQFSAEFIEINPHMTVPALDRGDGAILVDSKDILLYCMPNTSRSILDELYMLDIERLSLFRIAQLNPLVKIAFPKILDKQLSKLGHQLNDFPKLRQNIQRRMTVIDDRYRVFDRYLHQQAEQKLRTQLDKLTCLVPVEEEYFGGSIPDGVDCFVLALIARLKMMLVWRKYRTKALDNYWNVTKNKDFVINAALPTKMPLFTLFKLITSVFYHRS